MRSAPLRAIKQQGAQMGAQIRNNKKAREELHQEVEIGTKRGKRGQRQIRDQTRIYKKEAGCGRKNKRTKDTNSKEG